MTEHNSNEEEKISNCYFILYSNEVLSSHIWNIFTVMFVCITKIKNHKIFLTNLIWSYIEKILFTRWFEWLMENCEKESFKLAADLFWNAPFYGKWSLVWLWLSLTARLRSKIRIYGSSLQTSWAGCLTLVTWWYFSALAICSFPDMCFVLSWWYTANTHGIALTHKDGLN